MRLRARGYQKISGDSFKESDLYSPVLKATEARLLLALAATEGAKVIKADTKQAYLYGDCDRLIGGQNRYRRDTFFSYSRAFMARGRLPINGILIYQPGWRIMDVRQ